ncbi:MAG: hypothetical protein U1A77_25875 [Pirellulales bacterium]
MPETNMMRTTLVLVTLTICSTGLAADAPTAFHAVECEGRYSHHLQGVCTDERESIFWCFTTQLVRKHVLESGFTLMGIQTAAYADEHWWFGCYGEPQILLKADSALKQVERFEFDCSLGIVPIGKGKFLVARGACAKDKGCSGRLVLAEEDAKRGLAVVDPRVPSAAR